MHCPSCIGKIERITGRLPGVSDLTVNMSAERLSLRLAAGGAQAAARVAEARSRHPHAHGDHDDEEAEAGLPWWRPGKARLVFALGTAMVEATVGRMIRR